MSEVVWLPEALDDVARLRGFLQEQSPIAAKRAAQTLLEGADLLADHPELGRQMGDGTGRRELFRPFGTGGYVLRYLIANQTVFIIRVWHTKEWRKDR